MERRAPGRFTLGEFCLTITLVSRACAAESPMETCPVVSSLSTVEHEVKYVVPNAGVPALIPWLRARCRIHPEYAETQISSIYYDFPDWRLLGEKLNSTFLKTKVRLRWYANAHGDGAGETSFLEAKFKVGAHRKKVRFPSPLSRSQARDLPLQSVPFRRLPQMLHAHGFLQTHGLTPGFQITYTRLRFTHPASCHSFCLDYNIHVPRVNTSRLGRTGRGFLPRAVLEQKGPENQLSPLLGWLPHFGLQRGSFSKYSTCFLHLTGALH